jgi:hypothetical protein
VLIAAAVLKGYELLYDPSPRVGALASRWAAAIAVEIELLLGLCLLAGLWPRVVRWVAFACFIGFSAFSAYKLAAGETSCGCFGKVRVHPGVMLAFDAAAAVALLVFGRSAPAGPPVQATPRRVGFVAVAGLLACAPLAAAAARKPAAVSESGGIPAEARFVVLEPETWIGRPFPLFQHIDVGDRLRRGRWVLLFYHHDCPACREQIPRHLEAARRQAGEPGSPQFALIEVPPYGDGREVAADPGVEVVRGRLTDAKEWFVTTPLTVRLEDGRTVDQRGRQ